MVASISVLAYSYLISALSKLASVAMSVEYVKGYAIRRNNTCSSNETQCTKNSTWGNFQACCPGNSFCFDSHAIVPISYAVTAITIAHRASHKLRIAQIEPGIYLTGTGIFVATRDSRDSMLTIEFWLGAPVQIFPEMIVTRP